MMRFYILTLGCPKNEVDSEGMGRVLMAAGHEPVADPADADALIVNTCGFIDKAKDESLEHLKRLAALKRRTAECRVAAAGHGQRAGSSGARPRPRGKLLVAAGCMSQRYPEQLVRQIPELDGVLGTLRWAEIDALLNEAARGERPCWTGEQRGGAMERRTAQGPSAYLKIADGCNAPCAFCAIPRIKGAQRSKPLAAVVAEARDLAAQGVKEIVLIAQDTTAYAMDRGQRDGLAELLERLVAEVPEVPWYRVMYAYPAHVTERLLEVMAGHRQIVKYLDLPLQHGDPAVLSRMRRPLNGRQVVMRLREAVPDVALRSAFIVGYPGESEKEFHGLLEFLEEMRFDRVGVFSYSPEEGTGAAELRPMVPARVKRTRYARAMELQQQISLARHRGLVGRVLEVLIEGEGRVDEGCREGEQSYGAVGRSYRDAPEVDGLVLVKQRLPVGELVKVRIREALAYDLIGEAIDASSSARTREGCGYSGDEGL